MLPPVTSARCTAIIASADKSERIKTSGDADSEFEVRSELNDHYIEFSQRHDLRLDFDKLAPKDRINLMSSATQRQAAVKGNYGIKQVYSGKCHRAN